MAFPTLTFSYVLLPVFVAGSRLLRGKKGQQWLLICSVLFLLIFNFWVLFSCIMLAGGAYLTAKNNKSYLSSVILQFVVFVISRIAITFQYRTILSPEMGILVTTIATVPLAVCTMNNIGYLLDMKNGRCQQVRNFIDFLGFSLYLPSLFTGPFYSFADYQLAMEGRSAALFFKGLKSYVIGLGKTVLLGAGMISMWSEINTIDDSLFSPAAALLGLLAAAFAVYYILTGYNDMSVGLSEMFGLEMTKGYDHPIFARGFIDFLKRFNIYVWNWTQKYVVAEAQLNSHIIYFVLWIILMLLYGLEANMLIWGALFGIFASAEYYLLDLKKVQERDIVNMLYSMPCILFGFIFFCYFDLNSVANFIRNFSHLNVSAASQLTYFSARYLYPLLACVLFSLNIPWQLYFKPKQKVLRGLATAAEVILLVILVVAATAYLIDTRENPFLLLEVRPL